MTTRWYFWQGWRKRRFVAPGLRRLPLSPALSVRGSLWTVRLITATVFLSSLQAIFEIAYRQTPAGAPLILSGYSSYGRLSILLTGLLLIYFASQLAMRKQLAWILAFISMLLVTFSHLSHGNRWQLLIMPGLALLLLVMYRTLFVVKYELRSVMQGLALFVICFTVVLAYSAIGFARLAPYDSNYPHHHSIIEGTSWTVREVALMGKTDLILHSPRAQWFMLSLNLLSSISIILAAYCIFRPLAYRHVTLPNERARARLLLERYGRSSEDEFKLWPEDKAYFFGENTFIAYRVDRGVALVLGEPVGPTGEWPDVVAAFKEFCALRDWTVALVYVSDEHLPIFEEAGLQSLKIGEDAIVSTSLFATTTVHNKHFRGVMNKFSRLGFTFETIQTPIPLHVLDVTKAITDDWLSREGRQERGFALGYHDPLYLRKNRLYVVRDQSGSIVAFANAVASHNPRQATVDLMRCYANSETGLMDFLLANIILTLANENVAEFSLGLAPLAGVGDDTKDGITERVVALGGRLGLGGFSYEGLERFKAKFEPTWQPRYLVYDRGAAGLTRTLFSVSSIMGKAQL